MTPSIPLAGRRYWPLLHAPLALAIGLALGARSVPATAADGHAAPAQPPPAEAPAPAPPSPLPDLDLPETRARLGIRVQAMTPDLRAFFGAPAHRGVLVVQVVPGSPAARAGVRVGDVVTAVDGVPIPSPFELAFAVLTAPQGATVRVELVRERKPLTLAVAVAGAPPPGLDPEFWEALRRRMTRGIQEGSRTLRDQLEELERRLEELEQQLEETQPGERERT